MLSKNQIKFIVSLKEKKFRKEHSLFVVEGEKSVEDFLESDLKVKTVYATKLWATRESRVEVSKANKNFELVEVTPEELKKISSLTTPNEVLAICFIPENKLDEKELKNHLTIMLDEIKDPGNLGTIIRIADWFGINDIICSPECVDAYNPKTVQATMGSLSRIRVHSLRLENILKEIKGLPVYGASLDGENIYKTKLATNGILIIGNESNGISENIQAFLSKKISIPSFNKTATSSAESLNAAVATAIICSEFRR